MSTIQKPIVTVTRRMPGDCENLLRAGGVELRLPPAEDRLLPRADFLKAINGAHAVAGMLDDRWDAEAFDAAGPQLRVVSNYAVGYNNINVAEATKRGIIVTNTPDVLSEATADVAWGLLMAAARRFGESERFVRAGKFTGWGPNTWIGLDMMGKTLGIIGAGRIGSATARRALGWKMKVVYTHEKGKPEFEREHKATNLPLDQLLAESDFIAISVPLTEKTRHLIGARELALMKPTAVLVNTARGHVVDEKALVEALRNGTIFAAGLDVYEEEPKLAPGLTELENVVLLPHIGSAARDTRAVMAKLLVDNILAVLAGKKPPTPVN